MILLAVDIGNTTISFGILYNSKLLKVIIIQSTGEKKQISQELVSALSQISGGNFKIDMVLLCSVVPHLNDVVIKKIKRHLNLEAMVAGKDIDVPIKNKYDNPSQVGVDRLVGAYAAKKMFGAPTIIIDFGTAITIDVVNQKGEYEGGIIIPGIRLSAESLFNKTALLPKIESITRPRAIIGRNTRDSILSGIFYGYGTMCSGLVESIKGKKGMATAKLILTGGHTKLIKKYISTRVDRLEPNLVLLGLAFIAAYKAD